MLLAVAEEQLTELRAQVADHQSGGNELDALKEAKKEILRLSQKVKELESNQGGVDENKQLRVKIIKGL